jgi:hypothetical protein
MSLFHIKGFFFFFLNYINWIIFVILSLSLCYLSIYQYKPVIIVGTMDFPFSSLGR